MGNPRKADVFSVKEPHGKARVQRGAKEQCHTAYPVILQADSDQPEARENLEYYKKQVYDTQRQYGIAHDGLLFDV
jgi:hypothetical protein